MKYIPPCVTETAFNCPHCGALAKQYWYSVRADAHDKDGLPLIAKEDDGRDWQFAEVKEKDLRKELAEWGERLLAGRPFFKSGEDGSYKFQYLHNVNVSKCYNCDDISLWLYDNLIYPQQGNAPPANPDLPKDVRRDYDEASAILELSPRGAAALIRLCIQKLCKELGQQGKNINEDIAGLVKAGLDSRIQKALDAVRVIGNNAVHPGSIDLRDDRATAESLFRLLNLIAEKMISEPKHVDEVYALLPETAKAAIAARDGVK